MKHLVLILTTAILAGTALAQVTAADYQAWRALERASYLQVDHLVYQAWRASEQASYHHLGSFSRQELDMARRILPDVAYWSGDDAVYQAEQVDDGQQSQLAYQAWRHSEQAVYRGVAAMGRGSALIIVNP